MLSHNTFRHYYNAHQPLLSFYINHEDGTYSILKIDGSILHFDKNHLEKPLILLFELDEKIDGFNKAINHFKEISKIIPSTAWIERSLLYLQLEKLRISSARDDLRELIKFIK